MATLPDIFIDRIDKERQILIKKAIELLGTKSTSDTERNHQEMIFLAQASDTLRYGLRLYRDRVPKMRTSLKLRKYADKKAEMEKMLSIAEACLEEYEASMPLIVETLDERNAEIKTQLKALDSSSKSFSEDFRHLVRSTAISSQPLYYSQPSSLSHASANTRMEDYVRESAQILLEKVQQPESSHGLYVTIHGWLDILLTFPEALDNNHSTQSLAPATSARLQWLMKSCALLWDTSRDAVVDRKIAQESILHKLGQLLSLKGVPASEKRLRLLFLDMQKVERADRAVQCLHPKLPPEILLMIKESLLDDAPRILREKFSVTYSPEPKSRDCTVHPSAYQSPGMPEEERLTCPSRAVHYWCTGSRAWEHVHQTNDFSNPPHYRAAYVRCSHGSGCSGHFSDKAWIATEEKRLRKGPAKSL